MKKITRTVPILKSNYTQFSFHFFFVMDIKKFLLFFVIVIFFYITILFHQYVIIKTYIDNSFIVVYVIYFYTPSGRIGNVVASHAAVACSCPTEVALSYTMHVALRGYCP